MAPAALILAAGEGTRMRSALPKVAHAVLGVPMIRLVVESVRAVGCSPIVVVTGHEAATVEALVPDETHVRQDEQLGTGHAAMCADEALADIEGSLLVLAGDTPLLRPETLEGLCAERERSGAAVALLTARMADPSGYGRIVRDTDGSVERIVEHKDCESGEAEIDEVATGTYCFDARVLFEHLHRLDTDNSQGEFYLTDLVAVFRSEDLSVVAVVADDESEVMGVNTRAQLAEATRVLQRRVNDGHMAAGVTMTDPSLVWVTPGVTLGSDVVLEPMTFLSGETSIADGAVIGPFTRIEDSEIGEGARVDASVVREAKVGPGATVGPMGYIRPGTRLGPRSKVGTFVEVKNSAVGEGSKVPHLSYVGDAEIGVGVNVGAGSITCNYDGCRKYPTVIGDGAFIGSDTMLVAPVRIGRDATTGAGSAISHDVPDGALAVERTDQRTVEGWAERRRKGRDSGDKQGSNEGS